MGWIEIEGSKFNLGDQFIINNENGIIEAMFWNSNADGFGIFYRILFKNNMVQEYPEWELAEKVEIKNEMQT